MAINYNLYGGITPQMVEEERQKYLKGYGGLPSEEVALGNLLMKPRIDALKNLQQITTTQPAPTLPTEIADSIPKTQIPELPDAGQGMANLSSQGLTSDEQTKLQQQNISSFTKEAEQANKLTQEAYNLGQMETLGQTIGGAPFSNIKTDEWNNYRQQIQQRADELFAPIFQNVLQQQQAQKGTLQSGLSRMGLIRGSSAQQQAEAELVNKQEQERRDLIKKKEDYINGLLAQGARGMSQRETTVADRLREAIRAGETLTTQQLETVRKSEQDVFDRQLKLREMDYKENQQKIDQALNLSKLQSQALQNEIDFKKLNAPQEPILKEVNGRLLQITGDGVKVLYEPSIAEQQRNLQARYETMPDGTINQIVFDPSTGQSKINNLGRLGAIAKTATGSLGTIPTTAKGKLSSLAQSIADNPSLMQNLTPTKRGQILEELATKGINLNDFTLPKLSSAQRESLSGYDGLLREANNSLLELEKGIDLGPIASRIKAGQAMIGLAPEFTIYRSMIDNMSSQLLKLRSGAAVTPQEFARIKGFIPQINDDEKTAKLKIERFLEETKAARENYIVRATETVEDIVKQSQTQSQEDQLNKQKEQEQKIQNDPLNLFN